MDIFATLLSNLNYVTIFILMLLESTVIPVPSELVVAPAAYHAASGNLHVYLVILFATLGADVGATINYLAGYYLGRPIIYRFANSHIGHLCLLNQKGGEERGLLQRPRHGGYHHRTTHPRHPSSDFHPRRPGQDDLLALPALHYNRCRLLELHPGSARLVPPFVRSRGPTQRHNHEIWRVHQSHYHVNRCRRTPVFHCQMAHQPPPENQIWQ